MKEHGLEQVRDEGLVREAAARVLADNQAAADDYRSGNQKVLGFLVGQVMKELQGRADPKAVNRALREALEAGSGENNL